MIDFTFKTIVAMENGTFEHEKEEGLLTSGHHVSCWINATEPLKFETLDKNRVCDVVVVGGGIAGITTAYCLAKAGKKVIVVEDGFLGSGETGRTTAHLVSALDDRYTFLEHLYGEKTPLIAASHAQAINFIDRTIQTEGIHCDFKRLSGYLFRHPTDKESSITDEYEATLRAGLETQLLDSIPGMPFESGPCLEFKHQAQFHPMKYLKGLAAAILRMEGEIYTQTRAEKIEKKGVTANGFKISAQHIVVATNTPINDMVTIHIKQFPYRTYVIGALVPKNTVLKALWWDTGDQESQWLPNPYHYVRTADFDDTYDLLICGGEDHKTGQGDAEDITEGQRYENLETWMRERFPAAGEIAYRWSGQVMEPIDSLAFIGKNPGDKNIYIITGDSGNGLTHSTIGGMLIHDLILGIPNAWKKIYDPGRFSFKATGDFIREIGNIAAQYVDYIKVGDVSSANELKPGEGAIINSGLKKIAVYKDIAGVLYAYSAVCPHLGCVLQWNGDEKSFDCPCHGSRFTCSGKVINGPAISDLKKIKINP